MPIIAFNNQCCYHYSLLLNIHMWKSDPDVISNDIGPSNKRDMLSFSFLWHDILRCNKNQTQINNKLTKNRPTLLIFFIPEKLNRKSQLTFFLFNYLVCDLMVLFVILN